MNEDNNVDPLPIFSEESKMHGQQDVSRLIIKAIFDSTRSAIFFLDPNCNVIFLNKKAKDGYKLIYGKELGIGDCVLNYRVENDEGINKLFKESFADALQGNPVVNEQKLTYPTTNSWVRMEYDPVYDQKKVIGVVIRGANINERKNYELQIDKQKEKFAKIAWMQSHETRQPVATILGLINIIDRRSLTKDNGEIITMLEKTVEHLDKVVRHVVTQANSSDS